MISWMLARLEHFPDAVFRELELLERSPSQFQALRAARLIRRVPSRSPRSWVPPGAGPAYRVLETAGRLVAINVEDAQSDPLVVTPADLAEWRLDIDRVARALQEENQLRGTPGPLNERLYFVGDTQIRGEDVAVVLAFLATEQTARLHLRAVANLVVKGYSRFIVVCPSYTPQPETRLLLEGLRIRLVRLEGAAPLHLSLVDERQLRRARPPLILLSADEARSAVTQNYHYHAPIIITGRTEKRSKNLIEIDGHVVTILGSVFGFFLRLSGSPAIWRVLRDIRACRSCRNCGYPLSGRLV